MAIQKGTIKYVGTIGDIRHFKMKGSDKFFAGMVGGPTSEQINKDEAFVRTRENMNEFGGSASAGKSVRMAFNQLVKKVADSQLTGRLTGIMKQINKEDNSEARGQRAILITAVPHYLKGLEFNRNNSLSGVFNAPYTLSANADRNSSSFTVTAFNPQYFINKPAGSTHFRLINGIAAISDFAYNATSQAYEPKDATLNELSKVEYSDYLAVDELIAADVTVTASLDGAPVLNADVSLINVIGIEFYQQVGAQYYLFTSGNTVRIDNIF